MFRYINIKEDNVPAQLEETIAPEVETEQEQKLSEEEIPQIQATSAIPIEENKQEIKETASEVLLEPGIKIVPPDEEEFNSLDFSLKDLEEKEKQKEEEKKHQKEENKKKAPDSKETDFIPSSKLNDDPILPNV